MQRQRCVNCGYHGPEMQSRPGPAGERLATSALTCPKCEQSLYLRPPRSYAELEGFAEPAPHSPPPGRTRQAKRRRWRPALTLMAAAAASTLNPKRRRSRPSALTKLELVLLLALLLVVSVITVSRIAAAAGLA